MMSSFQYYKPYSNNKKYSHIRQSKKSELDSDMAEILEKSNCKCKITMIIILWAQMEKMDSMQEHMGNVSRDRNSLDSKGEARNQSHCDRTKDF